MLGSQRHLFDIPPDVAYLNNAGYAPIPLPVRDAGAVGVAAKLRPWAMGTRDEQVAEADAVRAAAAAVVGADPGDVAIVNAAAYGIATAAANVDVPPGSRILMISGEFPSAALAWARLAAERGATLDIVPPPGDGDWTAALAARIAAPGPPIAVAVLTPVVWTDGSLVDLAALTPALRAAGAAIVVDATQGAGVLDLDVRALGVDWLVFPSYKWLLGPYSLAFLYVAPHRQDGRPLEQHGDGRQGGTAPFTGSPGPMLPGARRFDMGEARNPVALPMAQAGMALLRDWGRAPMVARMRALSDALAAAAEAAGCRTTPARHRAPHILGVHVPDAAAVLARLATRGVHAAERGGLLRLGVHAYNDDADVARFAAALPAALHG